MPFCKVLLCSFSFSCMSFYWMSWSILSATSLNKNERKKNSSHKNGNSPKMIIIAKNLNYFNWKSLFRYFQQKKGRKGFSTFIEFFFRQNESWCRSYSVFPFTYYIAFKALSETTGTSPDVYCQSMIIIFEHHALFM
jgi:hypothetical protein